MLTELLPGHCSQPPRLLVASFGQHVPAASQPLVSHLHAQDRHNHAFTSWSASRCPGPNDGSRAYAAASRHATRVVRGAESARLESRVGGRAACTRDRMPKRGTHGCAGLPLMCSDMTMALLKQQQAHKRHATKARSTISLHRVNHGIVRTHAGKHGLGVVHRRVLLLEVRHRAVYAAAVPHAPVLRVECAVQRVAFGVQLD